SLSDRHESDYNFELIEGGFTQVGLRHTRNLDHVKQSYLKLIAPNPNGTLQHHHLTAQGYLVIHPGMGGSAFNWPAESYFEVAKAISPKRPIVITGTSQDKKYLDPIEGPIRELKNVKWLVGELSSTELLNILSQAKAVLAPSTGVIHLAASLGTPVFGIYSPKRQEHPRRWGPRGPSIEIFVPPTSTDSQLRPDVMNEIKTEAVVKSLRQFL
ncbi:MAG: glycosyltransferase family 9 protein, partial [Bdellovibrionales bacterium]|nr:glycosyltransferase family 9 protein [Bdellovibrionales bacterium]